MELNFMLVDQNQYESLEIRPSKSFEMTCYRQKRVQIDEKIKEIEEIIRAYFFPLKLFKNILRVFLCLFGLSFVLTGFQFVFFETAKGISIDNYFNKASNLKTDTYFLKNSTIATNDDFGWFICQYSDNNLGLLNCQIKNKTTSSEITANDSKSQEKSALSLLNATSIPENISKIDDFASIKSQKEENLTNDEALQKQPSFSVQIPFEKNQSKSNFATVFIENSVKRKKDNKIKKNIRKYNHDLETKEKKSSPKNILTTLNSTVFQLKSILKDELMKTDSFPLFGNTPSDRQHNFTTNNLQNKTQLNLENHSQNKIPQLVSEAKNHKPQEISSFDFLPENNLKNPESQNKKASTLPESPINSADQLIKNRNQPNLTITQNPNLKNSKQQNLNLTLKNNGRLLSAEKEAADSTHLPVNSTRINKKMAFLIDSDFYTLDDIPNHSFSLFANILLSICFFVGLLTILVFSLLMYSKSRIYSRLNNTIINVIIEENIKNEHVKFFIYGDFNFLSVRIKTDDSFFSENVSLSNSYVLDSNLLKEKVGHVLGMRGRYFSPNKKKHKNSGSGSGGDSFVLNSSLVSSKQKNNFANDKFSYSSIK